MSEPGFLIRRAKSAGYPTLVDLWLRSVRATHTFLTQGDIQALLPLGRHAALPKLELCSRSASRNRRRSLVSV